MKEERNTLKVFSDGLTEEEIKERNAVLLLMHQLSNIQITCAHRLEDILNRQGKYRHEIKHNHNQIKALIRKNMRNIFEGMSYEAIDRYCDDTDRLEEVIFKHCGIKTK